MKTDTLLIALSILMTVLLFDNIGAQEPMFGLKPLTIQEAEKLSKNKIVKVGINKLALKRINMHRAQNGLPEISEKLTSKKDFEIEGESSTSTFLLENTANDLNSTFPTQVDNSFLSSFPVIGNQGAEGSCVAFATTYYQMSHEVCLALGCDNKNAKTRVYSPRWTYNMINSGVNSGAYFSDAYALIQNHGAALVNELPYFAGDYRAWDLNPDHWQNAISSKVSQVSYIPVNTDAGINNAKQMLLNGHVLVVGTFISNWVYSVIQPNPNSTSNYFVGQSIATYINGTAGGHAMTVVGYDDEIWVDINANGLVEPGELGAFKIANSWGTGWKNAGFIWASYDAFRTISTIPNFMPTGRRELTQNGSLNAITYSSYNPTVLAKVVVSHAMRNQLNLQFASSSTSTTTPQYYHYPFALANKGGAYAFDGTSLEKEGIFYFDVSNVLKNTMDQTLFYLLASDNVSGNPLTIKSFEVIDPSSRNVIYSATGLPKVADGSTQKIIIGNYTPDTIAPTAPSSLKGNIIAKKQGRNSTRSIALSYLAATDNVGVRNYLIYRNGMKIAETTSLSYSDATGSVGVVYTYEVAAIDAAGNISMKSNAISIMK